MNLFAVAGLAPADWIDLGILAVCGLAWLLTLFGLACFFARLDRVPDADWYADLSASVRGEDGATLEPIGACRP
jgi:hypothetical protein